MSTRWATYSNWSLARTWAAILVGDAVLLGAPLAALLTDDSGGGASTQIAIGAAVLSPILFTWLILYATATSLLRLGVSTDALLLVFPRRTERVAWDQLQPPTIGGSTSDPVFEFHWIDRAGKRRSFVPDVVTAKYILDHPSCPRWPLGDQFWSSLDQRQFDPGAHVQVRIAEGQDAG